MILIHLCHCYTRTDIPFASEGKLWGLFKYDTVFTVSISLFVFASGFLINNLIKYLDKRKKQQELRHYFKHFLDRLIDTTCPKLIKMYSDVYQKNGINEGIPTSPPKILTSDFIRIKNIQDKDLFHSFKDKESLTTIMSNIDFLELMINEIDIYHKSIRKASDDIKKPLQEKTNKYFDMLGSYVEHVRKNKPDYPNRDDFRDLVNKSIIMMHEQKELKQKMTTVYRSIIRPIQKQVVVTNIFRNDPLGYEIAELGKDISIQYNYLKYMTIEFRLDYRKFSLQIKDSQKKLIELRQKINWD